jgi:hypothetical protein
MTWISSTLEELAVGRPDQNKLRWARAEFADGDDPHLGWTTTAAIFAATTGLVCTWFL